MKSKDAKKLKEFDINIYSEGFIALSKTDDIITQEYFQFKEIQKIVYYPDTGVEVVFFNDKRKVFYNDIPEESMNLFELLNSKMISWLK